MTSFSTINLLAAIQLWPALIIRLSAQLLAACSRSASARTIYGSLPPSSRTVFLIISPAFLATALPAFSLPVRVAAFTAGCSRSEEHTSELQSRGHLVCRLLLEKKTETPSSTTL